MLVDSRVERKRNMNPAEILILQKSLCALAMVFSFFGIFSIILGQMRPGRWKLFEAYGFYIFGIYHVAMFGERRRY